MIERSWYSTGGERVSIVTSNGLVVRVTRWAGTYEEVLLIEREEGCLPGVKLLGVFWPIRAIQKWPKVFAPVAPPLPRRADEDAVELWSHLCPELAAG